MAENVARSQLAIYHDVAVAIAYKAEANEYGEVSPESKLWSFCGWNVFCE